MSQRDTTFLILGDKLYYNSNSITTKKLIKNVATQLEINKIYAIIICKRKEEITQAYNYIEKQLNQEIFNVFGVEYDILSTSNDVWEWLMNIKTAIFNNFKKIKLDT